ncbi:hypothetical protein SLEP1_g31245 [Rubroshorea leprosula]|uniref:Non-haem dioxygenase N-terminal domain-containing protein n=1 Tax=Rubroshorea leprosula TaxID=152421 RepID=A0AAV5KA56_9ROSI|nr:hypothetical protein SLEP1_g31245 [Rubroshorea leprosula]
MGEVDPAFIQDLEHRPKLSPIESEGMPLIDLSPLTNAPDAIEGLVSEIRDSCKKQGFFQVISRGVPLEQRQKTEDTSRRFFT